MARIEQNVWLLRERMRARYYSRHNGIAVTNVARVRRRRSEATLVRYPGGGMTQTLRASITCRIRSATADNYVMSRVCLT